MLKRRLKLFGKILLGVIALCFALLLIERWRGQWGLAAYRRELAAKGEKLSPVDLGQPAPAAVAAARSFTNAFAQLTSGEVLPDNPPPRMRLLPSGRAVVGFREDNWTEGQQTNDWTQVELDLRSNADSLAQLRKILQEPEFNHDLDYAQGVMLLLPHLASAKSLSAWFGAASQQAIRQQHNVELRALLVAQAGLPKVLEQDRLLISELVRIAAIMLARSTVWEALQANQLSDEDWRVIQEAWARQSFADNLSASLEGDRIYCDYSYDLLRKSNKEAAQAFYAMEEWLPMEESERPWWERSLRVLPYGRDVADFIKVQIYCRIWRFAWSHQAQLINMKHFYGLTEIARTAASQKSFVELQSRVDELEAKMASASFYFRLRYPFRNPFITLSATIKRSMQAETERSVVLCAIALQRHLLGHGSYPESLAALNPEFQSNVPVDYMDGQPVKYRRIADDRYVLYSVGDDGVDDGGDASLPPDHLSVRNLWHRRDFVWPAPATLEEIEAYRRESAEE